MPGKTIPNELHNMHYTDVFNITDIVLQCFVFEFLLIKRILTNYKM